MVQCLLWAALVDRAAEACRLALHDCHPPVHLTPERLEIVEP